MWLIGVLLGACGFAVLAGLLPVPADAAPTVLAICFAGGVGLVVVGSLFANGLAPTHRRRRAARRTNDFYE